MLSNGFDRPLHLRRKTSRLLAAYLVTVHGLALSALLQPLALTLALHIVLYVGLFASAIYHIVYFVRQHDEHGYWVWMSGGVWRYTAEERVLSLITNKTVQTPWFVLVTLVDNERRKVRLLIIRDQVDTDTFRRLRVRLRLHHDEATAGSEESV